MDYTIRSNGFMWSERQRDACEPVSEEQVVRVQEWLRLYARGRKTCSHKYSSYGLKERVEFWLKESGAPDSYISNGAFIVACIREGYKVKPIQPYSPNAAIAIRKRDDTHEVDDVWRMRWVKMPVTR